MRKKLVDLLETFKYPVFLQGSLLDTEDYPSSFFTFWNFQGDESKHYDNTPQSCEWGFWVYFYSNDPLLVESELTKAKKLLKNNGFVAKGKPVDAASDVKTHTGKVLTIYYLENYREVE